MELEHVRCGTIAILACAGISTPQGMVQAAHNQRLQHRVGLSRSIWLPLVFADAVLTSSVLMGLVVVHFKFTCKQQGRAL